MAFGPLLPRPPIASCDYRGGGVEPRRCPPRDRTATPRTNSVVPMARNRYCRLIAVATGSVPLPNWISVIWASAEFGTLSSKTRSNAIARNATPTSAMGVPNALWIRISGNESYFRLLNSGAGTPSRTLRPGSVAAVQSTGDRGQRRWAVALHGEATWASPLGHLRARVRRGRRRPYAAGHAAPRPLAARPRLAPPGP